MKFSSLEKKLEKMSSIISCKIAGNKKIEKVHVLADNNNKVSEIIEKIKTAILVEEAQQIDKEQISIAQIEASEEEEMDRIEIISIYKVRNEPTCHFKLKINDEIVEEKVKGENGVSSPWLAAKGMLETISNHLDLKGKLELEDVFITGDEDDIIVVQVILNMWGEVDKQLRLIGASYINFNLPLASGKACLKALNRQLSVHL